MKTNMIHKVAVLAVLSLLLAGCGSEYSSTKSKSNTAANLITYELKETKSSNLESVLKNSNIPKNEQKFILSMIDVKIYPFVSLKLYPKNDVQILIIDTYLYDEWTNSATGEKGKSAHGSLIEYRKIDGDWCPGVSTCYGG